VIQFMIRHLSKLTHFRCGDPGASPTWRSDRGQWIVIAAALLIFSLSCQAEVTVIPGGVELEMREGVPAVPGDTIEPEQDEDSPEERERMREFIIAPLPSRNPLMGWTLSVPVLWLYEPSFSHPDDSVWVTGGAAFYSENESVGGGLFHKMSLGGDQWRITAAAFTADLRYDYFGIGGEPNRRIPLKQQMDLILGEALYRVRPNLYLGLQAYMAQTTTSIDLPTGSLPPELPPLDLSLDIDLVNFAPKLQFDTRDNPFYPRDGWLIEGTMGISRQGLGGDVDYERHNWSANRYLEMTDRAVLAFRGAVQYVGGDAPFFMYPAFGQGSDLRGYQTGTYRDRFLFAAQAEWRQRLSPRWGAVAFAGVGTVASDFGGWGETLPSAGFGIRWVAAPKNNLSVRVDFAWGKDDNEFYVSIGEAF
jgi:outer membrane protein assembly factor BamA